MPPLKGGHPPAGFLGGGLGTGTWMTGAVGVVGGQESALEMWQTRVAVLLSTCTPFSRFAARAACAAVATETNSQVSASQNRLIEQRSRTLVKMLASRSPLMSIVAAMTSKHPFWRVADAAATLEGSQPPPEPRNHSQIHRVLLRRSHLHHLTKSLSRLHQHWHRRWGCWHGSSLRQKIPLVK